MAFHSLSQLNVHGNNFNVRVMILRLLLTMKPDGVRIQQLHMLLLDNEGTEMQGVINMVHVPMFHPILHEGSIYTLRNFVVRPYRGYYRVSPATIRVCFRDDTVVEELVNAPDIPAYSFRFLTAENLHQVVQNHYYMSDIVGEVVAAEPEQRMFENEALLRRKGVQMRMIEGEIVEIVLWDTLIDNFQAVIPLEPEPGTIVVFTSVVVHQYNGYCYLVGTNATKLYWNLHYPHLHPLLNQIGNAPQPIDYTLEEALEISTVCSLPELNFYKTDLNNQGISYIVDAYIKDVSIFWSIVKLKFVVRLTAVNAYDEANVIFTSCKFRWIATRIIQATDTEWTDNFRLNLDSLRGKTLKLMIQLGALNALTNECDLVLHKLFS